MKIEDMKGSSPLVFERIENKSREQNVLRVLLKLRTTPNEKYWLVGFLKFVGYSAKETIDIIDKFNSWEEYNKTTTEHFVQWFFNRNGNTTGYKSPQSKPISTFTPDELIDLFLKNYKPFFPVRVDKIKDAAFWYHSRGFHVIPMSRESKKPYPGIKWLSFQDVQPSIEIINKWDWSYGIILIGTNRYGFLDIDIKSVSHPDGLEFFDESRLKGWCWERTKSGGYHVFGEGNMRYQKAEPISIRGKGAYIVAAPTPGYRLIL